jgi:hypothetical protein
MTTHNVRQMFTPFTAALRRHGFRLQWAQRRTQGCPAVTQYHKLIPGTERTVHVQLWGDGAHRANHSFNGHEITRPTDFHTVEQMLIAIGIEEARPHVAD